MTLDDRLWKQFNKALGQYQLIDEDDRILVGLSGGKDSLLLLEFLARRSRILKPRFSVEALHVRMEFATPHSAPEAENIHYETDTAYLQRFCDQLGIPLHIVTTRFDSAPISSVSTMSAPTSAMSAPIASASAMSTPISSPVQYTEASPRSSKPKPPCFLCSWQRRKQLFNIAQQHGCTKIALGHHQDDIIHTALMNLTFQGRFSTMPAKLRMRKMPLTIIRPLCLCQEADIRAYAEVHHYEKQLKRCPYENDTNRATARELLSYMERHNPEARYSIWNALETEEKLLEY